MRWGLDVAVGLGRLARDSHKQMQLIAEPLGEGRHAAMLVGILLVASGRPESL